ncbi:hypothetical protein SeLEV6574_g01940 [Synchytrium endobioticum]|nr:hypothetical protein SeLEV6574_g01940 [Synchytrium endobioticum]
MRCCRSANLSKDFKTCNTKFTSAQTVQSPSSLIGMRHGAKAYAKKLGRTPEHRIDLLRNLVSQLLHHERIVTTVAKAKFVKPVAERVINWAKKGDEKSIAKASKFILNVAQRAPKSDDEVTLTYSNTTRKLFGPLVARYSSRPSGYVRIHRYGFNAVSSDRAPKAVLTLVDSPKDIIHNLAVKNISQIEHQVRKLEQQKYRVVKINLTDPVTALPTPSVQLLPRHDLKPYQLGCLNAREIKLHKLLHKYQKSLASYPVGRELESKMWRNNVVKKLEAQRDDFENELMDEWERTGDEGIKRKKREAKALGLQIEKGGIITRIMPPWEVAITQADVPSVGSPKMVEDDRLSKGSERKKFVREEEMPKKDEKKVPEEHANPSSKRQASKVSEFFTRLGLNWNKWL